MSFNYVCFALIFQESKFFERYRLSRYIGFLSIPATSETWEVFTEKYSQF